MSEINKIIASDGDITLCARFPNSEIDVPTTDDIAEKLRDIAFKKCGPTMEAVHTRLIEWKAADALEAKGNEIWQLRAVERANAKLHDTLLARIAELESRIAKKEAEKDEERLYHAKKLAAQYEVLEMRDARIAELTVALNNLLSCHRNAMMDPRLFSALIPDFVLEEAYGVLKKEWVKEQPDAVRAAYREEKNNG